MKTPEKYREDAMRCRELLDGPVKPDLRVQLRYGRLNWTTWRTLLSVGPRHRPGRNSPDPCENRLRAYNPREMITTATP